MDRRGRRGRRNRYQQPNVESCQRQNLPGENPNAATFLDNLFRFTLMSCLIVLIYSMLQYHCASCGTKHHVQRLMKNMTSIAENLSVIENNYCELEMKILKMCQELPKIQADIDLQHIGKSENVCQLGWDPKTQTLPNVDVYLVDDRGQYFNQIFNQTHEPYENIKQN